MQQQLRLQIKRRAALVLAAVLLLLASANAVVLAQNMGAAPQVNVASRGRPAPSRKARF